MSTSPCSARRWLCGCLAFSLLLLVVGCGAGKGIITGTIYYKDKDGTYKIVPGGVVTFYPPEGKGAVTCNIEKDGTYRVERVPAGEVTILVDTLPARPKPGPPRRPGIKPPAPDAPTMGSGGGSTQENRFRPIPLKYKDPEQSDLKFTVIKGDQEHDIKLD